RAGVRRPSQRCAPAARSPRRAPPPARSSRSGHTAAGLRMRTTHERSHAGRLPRPMSGHEMLRLGGWRCWPCLPLGLCIVDAVLAAVRDEAVRELAQGMANGMSQVRAGPHTQTGARLRIQAVGKAYLDFARTESGLFDTAFTATEHPASGASDEPQPLEHVQ